MCSAFASARFYPAGSQRSPDLALVGGTDSFSEPLVRAMAHSLRNTAIVHLPSLEALRELPSVDRLRLLVVDEHCLRGWPRGKEILAGPVPAMSVALAYDDPAYAAALCREASPPLGISSFLPIDVRLDLWLMIIRLLMLGGRYVPPQLTAPQPSARDEGPTAGGEGCEQDPQLGLTPRQYAVLELLAEGLPNKVIAGRLGLSDHTVKLHIHNIIERLGVRNRTGAAARYHSARPS